MKKLILFTLLSVLSLAGFSQNFGRLKIHSGLYDNFVINGPDTSVFGWRTDRFQLKYNTNKRFIDFLKADSSTVIYNKLILKSPNDTMLSVRGVSSLNGVVHINDTVYMSGNFINSEPAYLFTGYVDSSSFVWGKTSTARARWSFSIGDGSSSEGAFGFASGNSVNTGIYGFSVNNSGNSGLKGFTSNVGQNSGESGTAVNNSENYGKWSFSANTGIVFAENASGFGLNTFNMAFSSFVIGAYNDTVGSYMYDGTSWVYSEPLFIIGNGIANHNNDAFRVLKNGKTFIGDSSDVTDAILVVDPTDSTSAFIGNVSITDTTFMEHLTVTDSVTLEDALFDIYHLAPDADSLVVADDGVINLRAGAYGELHVSVYNAGMYEEFAWAIINTDGSIGILIQKSTNVTTTGGTDGNLNIYDGGTYAIIENKLGGSRTIKYWFTH
jgi:hypothetical protein